MSEKGLMKKPLVSIIVPVYNREKIIKNCIDSLQNQSYENFEIIIVNDGSSDQTYDVCTKLCNEDQRIRLIHKENGGVSSARNLGIKEAQGEYIMFLDSDDFYEKDTVKKMVEYVDEDTLCICGFLEVNNKKSKVYIYADEPVTIYKSKYYFDMDRKRLFYSVCNKLYSRKKLLEFNLFFDEEVHYTEDFIFNLNYYQHMQKVILINNPYYHYVDCDESSLSKDRQDNFLNGTLANSKAVKKYLDAHPEISKTMQAKCYHSFLVNLLGYLDRVSDSFFSIDRKSAAKLIEKEMKDLQRFLPYINRKTKIEYWLIKHRLFLMDRLIRTVYFKLLTN